MVDQHLLDLLLDDVFAWNKWKEKQQKDLIIDLSVERMKIAYTIGETLHRFCVRYFMSFQAYSYQALTIAGLLIRSSILSRKRLPPVAMSDGLRANMPITRLAVKSPRIN